MEAQTTSVLMVGTYHFLEQRNADLYSPRVQDELDAIVAGLARFRPERVAVEAPVGSQQAVSESYRSVAVGDFRNLS